MNRSCEEVDLCTRVVQTIICGTFKGVQEINIFSLGWTFVLVHMAFSM